MSLSVLEQGKEFLNGEDSGDPPLWAPSPSSRLEPGHQSLTPSPFGVFTPDAWLKGPRKGKWLLLLLIFVMGAGCNNCRWRGERATAQQDPHPLLQGPGRSSADGPPEEGWEKLLQKCSKFRLFGGLSFVSLCAC